MRLSRMEFLSTTFGTRRVNPDEEGDNVVGVVPSPFIATLGDKRWPALGALPNNVVPRCEYKQCKKRRTSKGFNELSG